MKAEHFGFTSYENTITIKSGETTNLQIALQQESWMGVVLLINTLVFLCGCILAPLSIVLVYLHYRAKGRDKNMPKTIIPLFTPPANTPPYMLGTMKDEKVDREDIVGSIIDLAYRGYIKIKEIEKEKNYEIIRVKSDDDKVDEIEKEILDAIFNGAESVETKDLRKHFPLKYSVVSTLIENKVLELDYFNKKPKNIIAGYFALGFLLAAGGGCSIITLSVGLTNLMGYFTVFSLGLAAVVGGIALMIVAKFMPAKTEKGSKLFADILGFKMYLHTAERYRLQKLGPEEFEKYLSYAIVFKIEEEWAKKFEGIYEGQPEWFEGTSTVYNAWFISSFARSFSNATVTSMTPIAAGSASGSGWSGGGGSFGGFSGGGGGGGSSGGW